MPQVMSAVVERILDRMRVTAVIPDSLASEVQRLAGRRNLSESIVHALWEWVATQRVDTQRRDARRMNVQRLEAQRVSRTAPSPGRSGFPPFHAGPGTCPHRAGG